MNTEASPNRPPSANGEHRRALRDESVTRARSAAFWATFDAKLGSDRRWAESVAASWRRTPHAPRVPTGPIDDTPTR